MSYDGEYDAGEYPEGIYGRRMVPATEALHALEVVKKLRAKYDKALEVVEAARRFEAAEQAYHHLVSHADGRPAARQALRAALAAFDAVVQS
jgi:hypothetical protein